MTFLRQAPYANGTILQWDPLPGISGTVRVCGLVTNSPQIAIGYTYIVEPLFKIRALGTYTHVAAYGVHLREV